jgi:hypothetical protein
MRIYQIIILPLIVILSSCQASSAQRPFFISRFPVPQTIQDQQKSSSYAVIKSIEISTLDGTDVDPHFYAVMKRNVINAVHNSGRYRAVFFQDFPEDLTSENVTQIDVKIISNLHMQIDGLASILSFYPLTLWGPVQQTNVCAISEVTLSLKSANQIFAVLTSRRTTPYFVRFYGFFRTEDPQIAMEKSYISTLLATTEKLRKMELSDKDEINYIRDDEPASCTGE